MSIKIDNLAKAVAEQLNAYRDELADDLKDSAKDAAKKCLKEIRENSPVDTGEYKKGWKSRKDYESDSVIRIQIHNTDNYQLTHLLEHGHARVDGGRTEAKPHIGPAVDHAVEEFEKNVKMKVRSIAPE